MAAISRLYLDTNIFIAFKETGGEIGQLLVDLIAAVPLDDRPFLVTSELTLAELLTKPLSDGRKQIAEEYDGWLVPSRWLSVEPVTREVLRTSARVRARYKSIKLPDAIHLSTALGHGCSHLLTADTGIRESYDLAPAEHGTSHRTASLSVLRPETDVVRGIIAGLAGK
ncbi:hypothetical protein VE25_10245 [Devosia geojensis]|uniref:PIN domain-containing protein n=1 Tax=Devosia geojensis TaxID=443610 RepID=A0A0F5FUP8_9HYPH|nr:PIN domain-containing protein [Devosia geojensis]KKB11922.1 hypothetical protein VE25_10245 [Devosia geojensis]